VGSQGRHSQSSSFSIARKPVGVSSIAPGLHREPSNASQNGGTRHDAEASTNTNTPHGGLEANAAANLILPESSEIAKVMAKPPIANSARSARHEVVPTHFVRGAADMVVSQDDLNQSIQSHERSEPAREQSVDKRLLFRHALAKWGRRNTADRYHIENSLMQLLDGVETARNGLALVRATS
jgi:hypothetical protein